MLPSQIIEQGSLRRAGKRISVSVRIPWYRALPLSSITDVALDVDGASVARESITWTVDGVTYTLDELVDRWDRSWYVLDSAVIEGDAPSIGAGPAHQVHVFIGLHIPYLPNGQGGVLRIGEQDTKTLELEEVAA